MMTDEIVRKELLRLAGNAHRTACINTRRISAFYNVAEIRVRRQLTALADEKKIRLSGWDGRALRPYHEWSDPEEFLNSKTDGGHVRVDLL